jgi:hypothetical protein
VSWDEAHVISQGFPVRFVDESCDAAGGFGGAAVVFAGNVLGGLDDRHKNIRRGVPRLW